MSFGAGNAVVPGGFGQGIGPSGPNYGDPAFAASGAQIFAAQTQAETQKALQSQLLKYKQNQFNTLYGTLTGALNAPGNAASSLPAAPQIPGLSLPAAPAPGASSGPGGGWPGYGQGGPAIPDSVEQAQVNQAVGRNDSRLAAQTREQQQSLGGRGLGANSPLSRALQTSLVGQNNAANADADTNLRAQYATFNAQDARERDLAALQSATQRYASNNATQAQEYGSQLGLAGNAYGSQLGLSGQQYGSQLSYLANLNSSRNQLLASLAGALGNLGG